MSGETLMDDRVVWLNGKLVRASDAHISPFDAGFTVGDGVFETLVAYEGRAFAFTRHWRRLRHSCDGLDLAVPDQTMLAGALAAVIEANNCRVARLRITVTAGRAPLGSARGLGEQTIVVACGPKPDWPRAANVVVVPWPKNERSALAGLKTTSYAENVVALAHAKKLGADEAIFGNMQGHLCEGMGSNIFLVDGGCLYTPPLSSGCLAGVTRALVLELATQKGLRVCENEIPLRELEHAEEAFLTSTTREIHPIATVDGRTLARTPGTLTADLITAWHAFVATGDLDP